MAFLVAESGGYAGQRFPLGPNGLRIGRDPGNDIILDVETVSGSHATLQQVGGQFQLHDHSTNGSWINGQKFVRSAVAIQQGDSVLVGGHAFRLEADGVPGGQATRLETPAESGSHAGYGAPPVAPMRQGPGQPPAGGYAPQAYAQPYAPPARQNVNVHVAPHVQDYTLNAVITLICYLFVYPVGLILNIIFLFSSSSLASRTGQSPVGTTFLWVLFILFFVAPVVVGIVFVLLMALGMFGFMASF